jgi:hypothetical protein
MSLAGNSIACFVLAAFAVACAALLRWARLPGSGIMGGLFAGVLLGPSVLGAVQPDLHRRLFRGGVIEHETARSQERRHEAEMLAAQHSGAAPGTLQSLATTHHKERDAARAALESAESRHQAPMKAVTAAAVTLLLLAGGPLSVRRAPRLRADAATGAASRRNQPGAASALAAPLSMAAWSAGVNGAAAYFLMRWWGLSAPESMIGAAALAIGPWALTEIDRRAADDAEIGGSWMVQTAGRIASLAAAALFIGAMAADRGWTGALIALPLLALPLGWWLPARLAVASAAAAEHLLRPLVAALAAVAVHLSESFAFWPAVILPLLSGDGRWCGALIGALLPGGRPVLRTMRLVLGSMAAGPTQLAVTALAVQFELLSGGIAVGLLLGAAVIEATAPARRAAALRLIEAERHIG